MCKTLLLISLILFILKIFNFINISWLYVFMPVTILAIAFLFTFCFIFFIIFVIFIVYIYFIPTENKQNFLKAFKQYILELEQAEKINNLFKDKK